MENKMLQEMRHSIIIDERKKIIITGVLEVASFDEQMVVLMTQPGELVIKGMGLHITKIDVVTGDLALEGIIDEISYGDGQPSGGFFNRLFR